MAEWITSIVVAMISWGVTLIGAVVSNLAGQRRTENNMRINQAVIDTKIDELTREVREHNNFARRMPVVEEQIKVINHRVADLEAHEERSNRG